MLFYHLLSLLALQLSTTTAVALCSASDASTIKEALDLKPNLPMVLATLGSIAEACSKCAGPHVMGSGGFSDSHAGLVECLSPEDFARVVPPTAAPTAEATVASTAVRIVAPAPIPSVALPVLCKDDDALMESSFRMPCSGAAAEGFCQHEQWGASGANHICSTHPAQRFMRHACNTHAASMQHACSMQKHPHSMHAPCMQLATCNNNAQQ